MTKKKVRKVMSPTSQVGFKGKVTEIMYSHGIKLGLGHNTYSSIELNLGMTVQLDESDDPEIVTEMIKNRIHREIAQASEERKQAWLEELGVNEKQ